jgi:dTDP-4-amino-4,6-dideoxygalactose transaminase
MVKIQGPYAPTDFMILDMEEEDDSPIILGRSFLNTTNAVIYVGANPFLVPWRKGTLLL